MSRHRDLTFTGNRFVAKRENDGFNVHIDFIESRCRVQLCSCTKNIRLKQSPYDGCKFTTIWGNRFMNKRPNGQF